MSGRGEGSGARGRAVVLGGLAAHDARVGPLAHGGVFGLQSRSAAAGDGAGAGVGGSRTLGDGGMGVGASRLGGRQGGAGGRDERGRGRGAGFLVGV